MTWHVTSAKRMLKEDRKKAGTLYQLSSGLSLVHSVFAFKLLFSLIHCLIYISSLPESVSLFLLLMASVACLPAFV